ncbi:MAG TPA: hypothetical protein VL968_02660 [Rhodocyclaceae bacterium]|jgi:spermidine synthase|nr:hypothetical protein [Rhodocyclaceae bacterium]
MSEAHPLFELPNPFAEVGGKVLLLEPPWAKEGELRAQLLDESYAKPFVSEDGERRYLHFSLHLIQSAMRLTEPNALDLRYTHLFSQLAKYCVCRLAQYLCDFVPFAVRRSIA